MGNVTASNFGPTTGWNPYPSYHTWTDNTTYYGDQYSVGTDPSGYQYIVPTPTTDKYNTNIQWHQHNLQYVDQLNVFAPHLFDDSLYS